MAQASAAARPSGLADRLAHCAVRDFLRALRRATCLTADCGGVCLLLQNVQLDNDVTSGYGPETISMARPMNGVYTFYVNKYYGLGSIKDSQAVVQVLVPYCGHADATYTAQCSKHQHTGVAAWLHYVVRPTLHVVCGCAMPRG